MNHGMLIFAMALLAFLALQGYLFTKTRWGSKSKLPEAAKIPEPPAEMEISYSAVTTKTTQFGGHGFRTPSAGNPTAYLMGVSGPVEGRRYAVEKEIFDIGASEENDLCIDEDKYISSKHASLRFGGGSLFLFDLGSRNGTFINDKHLEDRDVVVDGDRLRFGMSVFVVSKCGAYVRSSEEVENWKETRFRKIPTGEVTPPQRNALPKPNHEVDMGSRAGIDKDSQGIQRLRLFVTIAISVVVLIAALYIILNDTESDDSKKWAFSAVGTIIGYWLKPS